MKGDISGISWVGGSNHRIRTSGTVWKCTLFSRNQLQEVRDVKRLKYWKKVPAGKKKNTRRLFAALTSGDPVLLKRQRSVE